MHFHRQSNYAMGQRIPGLPLLLDFFVIHSCSRSGERLPDDVEGASNRQHRIRARRRVPALSVSPRPCGSI